MPGPGPILFNGAVIGRHEGIHRWTVGQRLPGLYDGRKLYVAEIRPDESALVAALWDDLFHTEVRIREAAMAHRTWVRETMAELLTERFGYTSRSLADQLMIFLDGGLVGSKMARHVGPLETARDMAKQLLLTVPMSYHI